MRRTGETTRNVDNAIQKLFKEKEIFIPMNDSQLKEFIEKWSFRRAIDICIMETVIIEPLITDLQKPLYDRVLKRLQLEHSHLFTNKKIIVTHNSFELVVDKDLEKALYPEV